jgi:protein-tyrosine phosphatase
MESKRIEPSTAAWRTGPKHHRMNQISPHPLWIGTIGDLKNLRRLYDLGIRAVVQLAYEEPPLTLPHDFIACRFPLLDGGDNDADLLRLAVATVTHLLERKFATLVCCHAGRSRSPAVVAAALARIAREPFAVCVNKLAGNRAWDIHPALFAQLQDLS